MERIQLYPPESLKDVMLDEAEKKNISLSQLAVDVLMQHYGLDVAMNKKKPISELTNQILHEVEKYVVSNPVGTTFDLLAASETFRELHVVAEGKASTNRATIGKIFAARLGAEPFANIVVVRTKSGAVKKTSNQATMYEIVEEKVFRDKDAPVYSTEGRNKSSSKKSVEGRDKSTAKKKTSKTKKIASKKTRIVTEQSVDAIDVKQDENKIAETRQTPVNRSDNFTTWWD